ncbi:hypothetical protein [Desertivirga xinjiangensis]|uniref:hypothetical protein n=1 Tax=Desertivirga xinjiangensis TaxID=539206 RepID=UPI0021096DF0|nr:hypothetical protein [Pedobacter xinjiangensis]
MKPKFSRSDVNRMFQDRIQRIEQAIISRLILVGETFVKNARENGNYNDVTGNLRSSIGYIVMKNGKIVSENFEQSATGTEKTPGVTSAKKFVAELKGRFEGGYALIVVAGMEYAAAVESRGKDVLTYSGIQAEESLKKAMAQISRKVKSL